MRFNFKTLSIILAASLIGTVSAWHLTRSEPAPEPPHTIASDKEALEDAYNVRKFFGMAWGTYWTHCGVGWSADHVFTEVRRAGSLPKGLGNRVKRHMDIDAAALGDWEEGCELPVEPYEGQSIIIVGYPAGADEPSLRYATVYFHRTSSGSDGYVTPTWIAVMTRETHEPVVGGMSGGVVVDRETFKPIGILVTSNSPTELDPQEEGLEYSADFVALTDAVRLLLTP